MRYFFRYTVLGGGLNVDYDLNKYDYISFNGGISDGHGNSDKNSNTSFATPGSSIPFPYLSFYWGCPLSGIYFAGSWGVQNRRNYSFIEAIVVFAYIYGTNYILDIPIVFIEVYTPILKIILRYTNDPDAINLLTDIPLILIIAVLALNFCRTVSIGWRRYFLTLIFGLLYYRFITSHLMW